MFFGIPNMKLSFDVIFRKYYFFITDFKLQKLNKERNLYETCNRK